MEILIFHFSEIHILIRFLHIMDILDAANFHVGIILGLKLQIIILILTLKAHLCQFE